MYLKLRLPKAPIKQRLSSCATHAVVSSVTREVHQRLNSFRQIAALKSSNIVLVLGPAAGVTAIAFLQNVLIYRASCIASELRFRLR